MIFDGSAHAQTGVMRTTEKQNKTKKYGVLLLMNLHFPPSDG